MSIGRVLDERNQYMKAGSQRSAVFTKLFYDKGALLRHDERGFRQNKYYGDRDCNPDPGSEISHHCSPVCLY
jgi:hypothetical protein